MKKRFFIYLVLIIVLILFITSYSEQLLELARFQNLLSYEETKEKLRAQQLSLAMIDQWKQWEREDKKGKNTWLDYMCTYFITDAKKQSTLKRYAKALKAAKKEEYHELKSYLTAIWGDLKYFPVPDSRSQEDSVVSYEDSWLYERTYGGKRGHEGTDLMGRQNKRGIYPVISITDGVIEKIGWLPMGGYRIGIRAPQGGYFYYAHMYDYAKDFQAGDSIQAGDFLGFMGDSGYSEIEGTVGQFDVHLHLGIYVTQPSGEEISINPYWITKYLEQNKLHYIF